MRTTCAKTMSPLGENAFFKNQSGKVGLYHINPLTVYYSFHKIGRLQRPTIHARLPARNDFNGCSHIRLLHLMLTTAKFVKAEDYPHHKFFQLPPFARSPIVP